MRVENKGRVGTEKYGQDCETHPIRSHRLSASIHETRCLKQAVSNRIQASARFSNARSRELDLRMNLHVELKTRVVPQKIRHAFSVSIGDGNAFNVVVGVGRESHQDRVMVQRENVV